MSADPIIPIRSPQVLKPGLYIIATPIGNLRDITLRALDVLDAVDTVLAEDTRQTRRLLQAYNINTPLSAYHDHNVAKRLPGIIKNLQSGKSLALVSDAGTPLVSDPGFKLVRAAIEAGIDIIPLPGASAVLAALVSAGLPSDRFSFGGFPPSKSAARKRFFETFKTTEGTLIFFESGGRVSECLTDMLAVFGDRPAVLARELTKHYEETRRHRLSDLQASVSQTPPKGEMVILLGSQATPSLWDTDKIDNALMTTMADMGVKRASLHVAELSGWKQRDVYSRAILLKNAQAANT